MEFFFDFDNTIVTDDSDTFVPRFLDSSKANSLISSWIENSANRTSGWTDLMDQVVQTLQVEDKRTVEDISHAARQIPHHPEMLEVIRLVAGLGEVHIVSDANELYITSFLHSQGIFPTSVQTNKFQLQGDLYRVLSYHSFIPAPHGCQDCPENLCKTWVINTLLAAQTNRKRLVYFGDGNNDYCPVRNVLSNELDLVFARDDLENAPHARGLIKLIDRDPSLISAQVVRWKTGAQLLELVRQHLT
ncbi:hypothetical protein BASA81_008087 [Batrachochytrium salamandrivorans]|nr:hypothetical protein BASA81_008087 [Batrachochytrium salamandrivorans]